MNEIREQIKELRQNQGYGGNEKAGNEMTIELYCIKCKSRKTVDRQEDDPPNAVLAYIQCPECVGGDFDFTDYFDANGNPVPYVEPALDRQESK